MRCILKSLTLTVSEIFKQNDFVTAAAEADIDDSIRRKRFRVSLKNASLGYHSNGYHAKARHVAQKCTECAISERRQRTGFERNGAKSDHGLTYRGQIEIDNVHFVGGCDLLFNGASTTTGH